jgi:hypothetical protein
VGFHVIERDALYHMPQKIPRICRQFPRSWPELLEGRRRSGSEGTCSEENAPIPLRPLKDNAARKQLDVA